MKYEFQDTPTRIAIADAVMAILTDAVANVALLTAVWTQYARMFAIGRYESLTMEAFNRERHGPMGEDCDISYSFVFTPTEGELSDTSIRVLLELEAPDALSMYIFGPIRAYTVVFRKDGTLVALVTLERFYDHPVWPKVASL